MAQDTKDSGAMIKQTAKANLYMLMAMFMKANGLTTKPRAKAHIVMQTEHITMAPGLKTSSMDTALKVGLMVHDMKASILRVRKKVKVVLHLLTVVIIKGSSYRMK